MRGLIEEPNDGIALVLTTVGSSGASTYNPATGVLNIPNYSGAAWGTITGTLSNQTDLQSALDLKAPITTPTFITNITTPIVYGSAVANGDLILEGTSHATKTTSYINLQPTSGAVLIGTSSIGYVSSIVFQVDGGATGTVFQITGGNPYNPAMTTSYAGNTHMYTFDSQNFSNNAAGNTAITGGNVTLYSGAYFQPYQQALTIKHGYASIGGGTVIFDSENGGGPDPTASAYKIIQAKFLASERYYIDGNGKSLQGYDTSNYFTTVISTTGGVTFDSVGSGAGFTFSDPVAISSSLQVDSIVNDTGLAHGVYTPTRSAEANMDANVTMTEAQYMRVGNTVTVSGRFTADPTLTATATSFEITLPIASNIGAVEDCAGVAFCGTIAGMGAEVIGVVANDTAKVQWVASDITSKTWSYQFSYQVI